ncbi:hypothetical protein NUW58_g7926 [Xylaria curta]|uniref:Uncharacterized protein n=1 Tax=Xylaria curta TaxID=42375 RepID=A0ACC1NE17_9PEZI|nr:hypothetical protein NUW58_g7926 [Xylaria curta]
MATDDARDAELLQLWEEAVDEYSKKSKRESITGTWKTWVTADVDIEKLIEQHESDFSQFRKRRGKFWSVFKVTMTQLQRFGKVAQAGIGLTPFAPASIIVEAGLFLISSGSAVADTYDSLEELFEKIRDITDRLDEYLKREIDRKLRAVTVKLLCSLLDVFCEAKAAIRRGRGNELMRRALGKENKIQTTLDQLNTMVETEIALITAKTYATARRIDERAEADRTQELLRKALHTDVAVDNDAFHANIEASRIKLSGDWLLDEKLFGKWARMEIPVLWVVGKPGTGKTYLASRVISYLRQSPSPNATGYFYIREGMNTQHTPQIILKTIASQITGLHDAYRKLAIAVCQDDKSLFSPSSIWENLFVKPFKAETVTPRPLFVVIDGIDEATRENQELLIKMAKSLSDSRSHKRKLPAIQLLLLGRPEIDYDVSNAWRGEERRPNTIHLKPSLSKADVRKFITKGVDEGIPLLKKMRQRPSKQLRKAIIMTLSESSDGMFMLAKLMLAEIKDMNKPELIRQALAKPPLGLEDMFKRVITRLTVMGGFDKQDLNEIIMWVACAKRDLLLSELDLILKLRDPSQNGIVGLDEELRTRFGSFFSISHPEFSVDNWEDGQSVIGSNVSGRSAPSASGKNTELWAEADTDSDAWADVEGEDENSEDEYEGEDEDEDEDDYEDEYEDEYILPDSFFATTVKFGHASVGQHFRTAPFHEGIGMDTNLAQGHITITCLLFLNGNTPKRNHGPWRRPDLFEYSADHFLDHLAEIQLEALRSLYPIEFKRLSNEIIVLFRARYYLHQWLEFVSDKHKFINQLFSQSICSRLQECIPKPTDEASADPDSRWLQQAKASSKFLFELFAKSLAGSLLRFRPRNQVLHVLFLRAYMSTWSDSSERWTLPPNRPLVYIAESICPEEIRELASLSGKEKTWLWHLSLGHALKSINTSRHLVAAVEEYRHVIHKSDDSHKWFGRVEEALGLFALEEYEEAIAAGSHALESLPANKRIETSQLLGMIQKANILLGNQEAAVAASLKAWKSDPYSFGVAFDVINTAHRTGHYSNTVEIVNSILTRGESTWEGAEFLGRVMKQNEFASRFISIACKEMGQLDLARDAFLAVASYATKYRDVWTCSLADDALAKLHYQFYEDDQKAIEIWENIIKDCPETPAAVNASFALASLYFTNAVGSETADAEPEVEGHFERVSALMGRWCAQRGEVELARAYIRPLVKLAVRDLTDTLSSNDFQAYSNLGKALVFFMDRPNAEIAYAFTRPLQKSKELLDLEASENDGGPVKPEPSQCQGNTELQVPFKFAGFCDCVCHRRTAEYRSFSVCEICYDIAFCDECRQKLIDGNISYRVCNPKHPLLEVYPPKGLVTKGAEGYMVRLSDERVVSSDEWLSMISREWLGT